MIINKRKIKAYYRQNEYKIAVILGAVICIGLILTAIKFPNGL